VGALYERPRCLGIDIVGRHRPPLQRIRRFEWVFQLPARLPCLIPASLHTVLPRSSYLLRSCFDSKKHSSNAVDSDVLEMNSLPDYGDYAASDIRCSIHEDTVQVWVYWNGVLAEGYEMEIASIPIDCKAGINLLERHNGQT